MTKLVLTLGGSLAVVVLGLVGVTVLAGSWSINTSTLCSSGLAVGGTGTGAPALPSATQRQVVRAIVGVTKALGVPQRGAVIAVAVGVQESGLRDLTVAVDHDSLGVFQQRPSTGWGAPVQVTNVAIAAESFLGAEPVGVTTNAGLLEAPGWQRLALTVAAQDVQQSAFPSAYARWQGLAAQLVARSWGAPALRLPAQPRVWGRLHGRHPARGSALVASGCQTGVSLTGTATGRVKVVLAAARSQVGDAYVWGGERPRSAGFAGAFDCSGLVQWSFSRAWVHLPRTSESQWQATRADQVAASRVQAGDLVFFAGTDGTPSAPGHVGIVLDPGRQLMIDAPHTGAQVRIESYRGRALVGVTDPLGGRPE